MPRLAALLLLALCSTACLRSTTVVSVKPDGSGTIVQETGLSPQALGMLKSLAASSGSGSQQGPPDLFTEEQARKTADQMGVRFVSGEPIKTAQMEGYRANFVFDDIRKIQMKMTQDPTSGLSGSGSSGEAPFGFDFERKGESSVLTINLPEDKLPAGGPLGAMGGALPGGGANSTPEQNAQAIAMMKMMMAGLYVDISLDFDGRIVQTNAPHVKGNRLTLLQLDFDKLLANEASLQKLQGATDLKSLGDIPGLTIVTDRRVHVVFGK